MADAEPRYKFICPSCSGNISVQLDRIPPVQARFRCPHCKEPMDFPSREEARLSIGLPAAKPTAGTATGASETPAKSPALPKAAPASAATAGAPGDEMRFRVEKPGFQSDIFDRRGIRNLIRTGEVLETDRVRVNDSGPVTAGDLPYLKSLFSLASTQKIRPPACCRTHTEKIAFFRCQATGRPLCEECAPERKFGGATVRLCQHCGGSVTDLVPA